MQTEGFFATPLVAIPTGWPEILRIRTLTGANSEKRVRERVRALHRAENPMKNTLLRKLITDIDGHLVTMGTPPETGVEPSLDALNASWVSMVKLLDLGPEPEVRDCPSCRGTIMRAATRCMHCWHKSAPPKDEPHP